MARIKLAAVVTSSKQSLFALLLLYSISTPKERKLIHLAHTDTHIVLVAPYHIPAHIIFYLVLARHVFSLNSVLSVITRLAPKSRGNRLALPR